MKILSLAERPTDVHLRDPSRHFSRVKALRCEVVECYDAETLHRHGESADAILMSSTGTSWPTFWPDVADYLESLDVFLAIFHVDSYKPLWPETRRFINADAVLPSMLTAYRSAANGKDPKTVFWSPCCVETQLAQDERDIDVLFWGNPGRSAYPFRNFVLRELTRFSYEESVQDEIIYNRLRLPPACSDRHQHVYARIPFHNKRYWDEELYSVLGRAKLCCTGSAFCRVPVARYFENAACGVVSVTNQFSDMEDLGFRHGENIWLTDERDLISDLSFLLENGGLIRQMSANATELIADRHTPGRRAQELAAFLEENVAQ